MCIRDSVESIKFRFASVFVVFSLVSVSVQAVSRGLQDKYKMVNARDFCSDTKVQFISSFCFLLKEMQNSGTLCLKALVKLDFTEK